MRCLEEFEFPLDFSFERFAELDGSDDLDCDADEVLTVKDSALFPRRGYRRGDIARSSVPSALLGGLPRTLPEMRKEAARRSVLVRSGRGFRGSENGRAQTSARFHGG